MGGPVIGFAAVIVESTPYRLRYRLTANGQGGGGWISNFGGGASPNLHTDLTPNAVVAPTEPRGPLRDLIDTPVASAAEARRLLCGEENAGAPNFAHVRRGHVFIRCRADPTGAIAPQPWTVDVDEGAAAGDALSAGRAVVTVGPPAVLNAVAYLDVIAAHFDT